MSVHKITSPDITNVNNKAHNTRKQNPLHCHCYLFLCLQLRAGCISPLKNLRRLGILRIQDFFDGFDSYSFSPDELDAVFQAVVWPQVPVANHFCVFTWVFIIFALLVHTFLAHGSSNFCWAGVPSPHREPVLPHPSAETHPCVVQKCQVGVCLCSPFVYQNIFSS